MLFIKHFFFFGLVLITIQQAVGSEALSGEMLERLSDDELFAYCLACYESDPMRGSEKWEDKKIVARAARDLFDKVAPIRQLYGYDAPIQVSYATELAQVPMGIDIIFGSGQIYLKTPWNVLPLITYRRSPNREQQAECIKKIQEILKCGYSHTTCLFGPPKLPVGAYDKLTGAWETVAFNREESRLEYRGRDDKIFVGEDIDPIYNVFEVNGVRVPKIVSQINKIFTYKRFGRSVGGDEKEKEIIAEARGEWPKLLNELAKEDLK